MEFLRDPFWQSVGAVAAILALLLYVYVERDKISKLYTEVLTRLRNTLGRLGDVSPAIVRGISILISALFLSLLAIFILIAPIFLFKELIQRQPLYIEPFIIDSRSMIYGLVVIVWCISIMTFRHKLVIDELRAQIDYLNRIPGIKELKNKYNSQLFDSALKQWNDFRAELANQHDDSPFAIDLVTCFLLNVQDETLIIGCPNNVIHKRLSKNPLGDDKEYDEKMRDKRLIEGLVKKQFQVRKISYILKR